MPKKWGVFWIILGIFGGILGCHKSHEDAAAASAAPVQGIWTGRLAGVYAAMVLSQSGSSVSGAFETQFSSGRVSGLVNGTAISFQFNPAPILPCPSSAQGNGQVTGSSMTLQLPLPAGSATAASASACPAGVNDGMLQQVTSNTSLKPGQI